MAKWQDTYEELKKRKKAIDNTTSASERQEVSSTYKNNTGYQNNLITTKNNIDKNNIAYIKNTNTTNNIAPTSTKKDEKKWYQNNINLDNVKKIVDTEHLKDGYDFGDVTKTILGTKKNLDQTFAATTLDAGTGLIKGVSDIGVSAAKLIAGGTAQVADWAGKDEYAEKVRKRIAGQDEETNKNLENKTLSGLLNKANKKLDEKSILGETADEIAGGVGYYAGMLAAQSVGVPWQVTAGVTSAGNELGNAYANGADDWEAWLSSGISAGVEIGSEYIFGGVKLPGTGTAIEPLLVKVTDKISKNGLKYLTQIGIQVGGEGLEEVISGIGSAIGQKLTYMDDKELKELYTSEDALKDFVIGAAVSGITMGANPNTYQNIKDGRSLITGRTTEEAVTIENLTKEAQKNAEKLKGTTLTTQEKKTIENVINGEVQSKINELKETLENTQDENKKTKIQEQITELQQQVDNVYSLINNENQNQENTENNIENNTENIVENNVVNNTTNNNLNNIANQIQALENRLDTSQNAVQQQEILNQIDVLEQKYNEILQQEQNKGLPMQEVQPKEIQTNEDIGPIQEVQQKEISKPTTQETKTNSSVEAESNTPKDVKSSSNIEVGKNNQNVVNKEVNNEVNQIEERKVINNEITENLQEQSTKEPLEKRVSGDALLDAQDFISEVKSVGANVDENGYVTVYHQTTNENAEKIKQTGKMSAKEPYVYFSTSKNAQQSEGRGTTKLEFKIPAEKLLLDDIFSDNADVKMSLKNVNDLLDVNDYLIRDTQKGQEKQIQGLENYSRKEIKDITRDYIQEKLEENNLYDVEINNLEINGSRNRGTAKENSDLDIVVEYTGDIREDDLFNILNEDPMYIDGVQVDINPINEYDTGTLKDFMERSNKYDKEVLSKLNENSTPTQQELDNLEDIRLNKSGSEYASAFYNLESKYGKANLYKGLNEYKSTGKVINNEQVVKQVSEQVEDAIAPIQETVKELKQTLEEVKQAAEETKTITEADLEDFYRFTQETASNEAPIENNNLYQEDISQEYGPVSEVTSPLENRNIDEVGNRSVKAYQYEHPEVRPYFQQMAKYMLTDLNNSVKGEKHFNSQVYYDTNGEAGWIGTKRQTTSDIADLLDNFNYSYADIRKGLEAIIKDNGAENIAVAKKIEFALDERLRNGYTDVYGYDIPAGQNYINMLKEQEWNNYYSSIPVENIEQLNESEIVNLENQIDNALSNSKSKSKSYLGKVTNRVATKIKSLLGIEVKNRKHVLSDNDIRHMMKQHSNQDIEIQHGQIAITKEDIKNIPDIINNPDDITKGTNNKLGQTIRYIKRYNDNSTYVVEVVPDNSNALIIKTMWKKPSTLTNSIAPSSTSETQGSDISSTFTGNISQNMGNVNDIAPLKERYEAIEPNKASEDKYEDTPMIKVKPDKAKFEKAIIESNEDIKNELGYYPKDPTKESSYDLTDTSENKKIAEILTEEPKKVKKDQRLWATMKANLFDKGAVFEDLSIKTKNRNLMGKWDYTLTSEARAQNVIGNGHKEYDASTKSMKQTSKSLNDIVSEVENTGLKKEFYDYMYHKHNVDRMNLESKAKEKMIELENESINTNDINVKDEIKKEIKKLSKIVNKPVFGDSVTSEVSQEIVEQYENENPIFMDYAKDVYDYVNADRQELVKEGVISQETADLWSEMYPHYVPIRRVDTNGNAINVPLDTGRTGINAPIKKATGGDTNILPLFDTMALRTLQTYKAIAKNNFGVELKNTLNTIIENQQTNVDEVLDSVDQQETLLQEGKNGKNPTFTVFENGEKVTYEITQDMYDALKPLSESSLLSKTFKPFNTASNFHRGLLTEYNPVFMITNAVKDIQDVLINSQHTAKTYAKLPEAYSQLAKKGYWYQEYVSNGGEQNSYFDSQENTFKTENKGIKKLLDIPPLSTISKMNNFIEMAPRLAEYIASRESGRSVEVSMLDAARVTTNFKAGGNVTKWANRNGATFLNASVQGAMQQVRNVREANMNGLRGWANLATKFAMAGLPAILLNGLMWDDDDDYEELSDYVKQNYYVVWKKDDGTFIRIPKGRTVAVIQEAIQQIENAKTGDDKVDLKSFLDLVLDNLAPNNPIDNNILSPITQVMSNKTWYGEDLVPTRLQDVPANEQYDESTDTFSRWLGDKLNISPMKINYVLNQYSGGVGDVVLPMITPKATNDADSLGDYLLAPFKDKFTTNATMNNKNPGELFETSEKLTTNAKSSKATDDDVLKNKFINSIKTEMNELYKQKREVQSSNLSKGEKYEQVLEIQSQINELSKYGLNNYKDVNISENYATVGNRQYKLNSNDEWEKITDKQIAKQEEVSNSLNISASEYWSNKEEYDYAYENPGKYAIATAIVDYETYKTYSKDINELKADKDEDGKSISGSRKEKVISYVNELDLSIPQKAMLIRQTYSSFDDYNDEIVNYVVNLDIDYDTKKAILEALDMKVYDDGSVGW